MSLTSASGAAAPPQADATNSLSVSVVIPAYNAASTLATALESLVAQTYPRWQAVIVDDGSKDDTADIAARFAAADERFRLIQQANGGEAAARNAGIAASHCDWLLFLDADDWIAPEHLERLTKALADDPSLDAVHCRYARVAGDGARIVDDYLPPSGDMFATLALRAAFPVHACLVRRTLVDAVGRFDSTLRKSPDWDLWQRVARTGARFGHVDEVLAYYRMQPNSASLDARQLLIDDLRVLERGHSPDPRVPNPHPNHVGGLARDQLQSQKYYLLCWCAGLLLGNGEDARPLFEVIGNIPAPDLYADGIARCLFDAAPLPTCHTPQDWEDLWRTTWRNIEPFLVELETRSGTPKLAQRSLMELKRLVLKHAPAWQPLIDDYEQAAARQRARTTQLEQSLTEQRERELRMEQARASLESDRNRWQDLAVQREHALAEREQMLTERQQQIQGLESELANYGHKISDLHQRAAEREQQIEVQNARVAELETEAACLEAARGDLRQRVDQLAAECSSLANSLERRAGDYLLNRLRLRRPLQRAGSLAASAVHRANLIRLATDRRVKLGGDQLRVVATACCTFPIYSQTFVYQELRQLMRKGFALRFIYSTLDSPDKLQSQFAPLWKQRRRLILNRARHQADYERYRRRLPEKVETIERRLCEASGLSRQALVTHDNFLEAFTFTRMVEANRPHYLHSYFFYDRSLMALVAGHLLDIPRGVSCYADHALQDYELKVVPLHIETCDVVIATSDRIKRELMALAPHADAERILVKPNGIDVGQFPRIERAEPGPDAPFRVVSVCRIEPKKGLLEFVEAIALLRKRGLAIEAHIVGTVDEWSEASRDYKRRLDERITALGLWGVVHLEGRHNLEGIKRFLGISQLFVAPFVEVESGDKDGIPTAMLEGMATGLPVVATDAGSILEVIDPGQEGLVVPQRDPAALAEAIETLLRDPDRRSRLGENAALTVRTTFDADACEESFHQRIRALVAARRAGSQQPPSGPGSPS